MNRFSLRRSDVFLLAVLFVASSCSAPRPGSTAAPSTQTAPAKAQPARVTATAKTCLKAGADLSHPKPLAYTAADFKGYVRVYGEPDVKALRDDIDRYRTGRVDGETRKSLATLPVADLARPFYVLSTNRGLFGGTWLEIHFSHALDAIDAVWMYRTSDGVWHVRAIDARHCTAAESAWFHETYGPLEARGPVG